MSLVSKSFTFSPGGTILSAEHNTNFNTIYDDYNGNITNANLSASAGIVDTKLAQITTTSKVSTSALTDSTGLIFQTGMIIMWGGTVANIPTGWVICDGNNGSPDLTDRFVLHADADAAGTNNVGDTGGASTHALSEAELPAHTHSVAAKDNGISDAGAGNAISSNVSSGSITSGSTGSGTAHTNRDKYYALAYIYKT